MRYMESEEIDRVREFWGITDINKFCDRDGDWDAYEREAFRYRDILCAYDDCPHKAGTAYNKAKRLAVMRSQAIYAETLFTTEQEHTALDAAFKAYCHVMTEKFFNKLIQYRWQIVQQNRQQSNVISQVHYRDYLDALDVASYAEYTPPVSV